MLEYLINQNFKLSKLFNIHYSFMELLCFMELLTAEVGVCGIRQKLKTFLQ